LTFVQPVKEGKVPAVPPLSEMLTIITSPITTPVGLAMVSVLPAAWPFVVTLPRWKMLVLTTIDGLEAIAVGVPPALVFVLVVKV
jgi:hypothetical protein